MSPILILGAHGQVGRALYELLDEGGIYLSRAQADLSKPESLPEVLNDYTPSAVINAAAYTQVDKAEEEEAIARRVNGESPGVLAAWCAKRGIPLIHFSTDYVFNGTGESPWKESDAVAPLNAYGRSKHAGEEAVEQAGGQYLIFRTSWVYDAAGKNFFNTMLRLGAEREELRIVKDQHGAPTYAPQLADAAVKALRRATTMPDFPSGIYHLCHAGETTWYDFALNIFEQARARSLPLKIKTVHGIESREYPTPAARPHNSRLDCAKAQSILGVTLPSWEHGLTACMEDKADHERNRLSA